jgi:lipopolysaccharide export system ATP-binding protein
MGQLVTERLSKTYRKRQVVKEVSLEVKSGEVVGLLGPNGAGKTTCFYMIVGIIAPDGGEIRLGDETITELPMHQRARRGLGYLAQEPSIFRRLSVEDNMFAVLETRRELGNAQRRELCDTLLREFGIKHLRDNIAMSLSGGERRRLEIARSIAMEPRYILLDEPFAGVDPISVRDIQEIVRTLADEGIGVLITDHNVRETLGICDRAYIINEGEVLSEGAPETILDDPEVRDVYLGHHFRM